MGLAPRRGNGCWFVALGGTELSRIQCSWPCAFNLHFGVKNFLLAITLGCEGEEREQPDASPLGFGSLSPKKGQLFLESGPDPGRHLPSAVTSPRQGRGSLPAQT